MREKEKLKARNSKKEKKPSEKKIIRKKDSIEKRASGRVRERKGKKIHDDNG